MAWRVAKSILTLHEQLRRGAPRAAPPATSPDSWGTLGDVLHDSTSDHVPHDFPGWANDVVTAGDFPNVPDKGLNAWTVLDDIRQAADPRAKYGISNDKIFSNHSVRQDGVLFPAWTWRPYLPHTPGRDRHYEHGHLSVVGDARADGTQPWPTIGAPAAAGKDEDDMTPIEIKTSGVTSLTVPKTGAWQLSVTNDTNGIAYGLRIWFGTGKEGDWAAAGDSKFEGLYTLKSGKEWTLPVPPGTACVTISRKPVDAAGKTLDKLPDVLTSGGVPLPTVYGGHLTCSIHAR